MNALRPEDMVVTDMEGNDRGGDASKPSSDLDTHTLLYREFTEIGAVVHTHSEFATSFAQAGLLRFRRLGRRMPITSMGRCR